MQKKIVDLELLLNKQTRLTGIRANFISNSQGDFTGASGSSRDLSNSDDLALLIRLRSLSDVIVTDASTARIERYRPSKWAPIQVWSKTGDFDGLVEIENLSLKQVSDIESAISSLKQQYQSILLETGPTLTGILGQAALIDELKLSLVDAAKLTPEVAAAEALRKLHLGYLNLNQAFEVNGTWFLTFGR